MRSEYLTNFRKGISELNNCFSHYIFVWEQFYIDNQNIVEMNINEFTKSIYKENTNSEQFYVRLDHLIKSKNNTYNFILNSLFILSYTQFEIYIRTFFQYIEKSDPVLLKSSNIDKIPDDFFNNLNIDISKIFTKEEILTFEYIRLRRNREIHNNGSSDGKLGQLIKNNGRTLNEYWIAKLNKESLGIDFKSENTSKFDKGEIFDLMNILRYLSEKIDEITCNYLGRNSIIGYLLNEFKTNNQTKFIMWGDKKTKDKFLNFCRIKFDLLLDYEEIKGIDFDGDVA